ncbi:hypothetical protein ACVWYG_002370 [Pedobacter sp. UYEF25]
MHRIMATFKVNVNKLNLRIGPATDFANKENVVGVLHKDAVFESVAVIENELGKWHIGENGTTISDNFVSELDGDIPPELVKYHDKIPKIFMDFHLGELWELPMQEGLKIGIIDTGVDEKHFALKGKVLNLNKGIPISIDGNPNHATTMACIIAGDDPENGIIGVAPGIEKIYSYTLPPDAATPEMFLAALKEMDSVGVQLINISYTRSDEVFSKAKLLIEKIDELAGKGCMVICATGNRDNRFPFFYPAAYTGVISVAGHYFDRTAYIKSDFWIGVNTCMCSEYYFGEEEFEKSFGTSSATALITGCLARGYKSIKSLNKTKYIQDELRKFDSITFFNSQSMLTVEIPAFNVIKFIKILKT